MHPDWKNFLQEKGAVINDDNLVSFNHGGDESGIIITPVSYLSVLHISGSDTTEFLNGQFTTNIKQLKDKDLQFSAWCNPKGQVKTTFFIYKDDSDFYLLLPEELREKTLKQLQMYIMRSDVIITDKINEYAILGLHSNTDINTDNGLHCVKISGLENKISRSLVFGSVEKLIELWDEQTPDHQASSSVSWKRLDIQSGYPWLSSETSELFLPQMLNLDLINGLNYQKGCYPGQEIIARLHFRGELKRSLHLASCSSNEVISPGDKIFSIDTGKSVGTIINTVNLRNDYCLLAVIDKDSIESQLLVHENNSNVIQLHSLPYQD